jgi:hypothetical protein
MEQKASLVGGCDGVVEQHDAIVEAVEAHDAERAQSALRTHLESVRERIAAILLEKAPNNQNTKLTLTLYFRPRSGVLSRPYKEVIFLIYGQPDDLTMGEL